MPLHTEGVTKVRVGVERGAIQDTVTGVEVILSQLGLVVRVAVSLPPAYTSASPLTVQLLPEAVVEPSNTPSMYNLTVEPLLAPVPPTLEAPSVTEDATDNAPKAVVALDCSYERLRKRPF